MQKVDFFSKARVSVRVRVRVRVSFSSGEMTTFDEPDGVQRWQSDSRRVFGKGFGPKVCKKWTFSKARVSVRVRVRVKVSFSMCEKTTFDEPDGVQRRKVIQEEFLEKVFGPNCAKSGLFFRHCAKWAAKPTHFDLTGARPANRSSSGFRHLHRNLSHTKSMAFSK